MTKNVQMTNHVLYLLNSYYSKPAIFLVLQTVVTVSVKLFIVHCLNDHFLRRSLPSCPYLFKVQTLWAEEKEAVSTLKKITLSSGSQFIMYVNFACPGMPLVFKYSFSTNFLTASYHKVVI